MVFGNLNTANPDMSIIPSFATLNEATFYVLESNESAFTEMLKNIGIRELGLFESAGSSSILYEAESNAETKKEIEKYKVTLLTKIKTLFENAMNKILNFIKKFALSIQMHWGKKALEKDMCQKLISHLPNMGDAKVSRYPWDGLSQTIVASNFSATLQSIAGNNGGSNAANANAQAEKLDAKRITNILRSSDLTIDKYMSSGSSEVKEVKKEDVVIKDLKPDQFETIFKICTDFKNTETNLKAMYQTAKAKIAGIEKASALQLQNKSGDAKESGKEDLKGMKYSAQVLLLVVGTTLSEYYNMVGSNMSIITTVFKSYNKSKKGNEVKTESYYYGDSELSSLFDWTY